MLIELEGHGREELVSGIDIDLSRTVGWFTDPLPVRLTPRSEPGASIKAVKEQLRGVPGRGMGFGVLRYLTAGGGARLAEGAYPQVSFNYLGQFDQSFQEDALWRPAQEGSGMERSPSSRQRCWFRVGAHILERCLTLNWSYSRALHTHEQVQHLLDRFTAHLKQLTQHLASGVRGVTPSDFPLANLTQAELDALPIPTEQIEDLYPMTPLQQGLLFHSLQDPQGGMYVSQLRVDIEGLDVPRFKAAWQAVFERHEILRTGFLSEDKLSLQWVARQISLAFVERDLRGQPDCAQQIDALPRRSCSARSISRGRR